MRVLHLNSGNLYGGVETVLTTMARLRQLCPDMEPSFAVCHEGRFSAELVAAGVPVYRLGPARISRPWTVWNARRRLREVLRSQDFDVVVCHMPWSLIVFGEVAQRAGKTLVFWAHGFHTGKGWLERLASRVTPDLAIANSRFTASSIANLFRNVPSEVVYCPVELAHASQAGDCRMAVRKQQDVNENTVVIIQVSRLERWKGHRLHLQALSQLPSRAEWVCWIVGGPQTEGEEQYLDELKQMASRFGIADRVRFLGQRSDVPQLLAGADVFCQPNEGPEPFGIVFIEALSSGCPTVSTAIGGAVEIIDETCGFLVNPGDPRLLADSLQSLIQSPELRRRLGSAGPERARHLCDPETQLNRLRKLLSSATTHDATK